MPETCGVSDAEIMDGLITRTKLVQGKAMLAYMTNQSQVYDEFSSVLDQSAYEALPDDWLVGMTDIVDSTSSVEEGRYQDVNFAGVAIIAALGNILGTFDFPFTFGGDGAAFAVPSAAIEKASRALRQVRNLAQASLDLSMRIGLFRVCDIRASGRDIRIARYAASPHATYTMFSGGGIRWCEQQLKLGKGYLSHSSDTLVAVPDLTGLSCDWQPFPNKNGTILSLMVEPVGERNTNFANLAKRIVGFFENQPKSSAPIPEFPSMRRWSTVEIDQKSWAAITANSDFKKYDDVLRLTVDCSLDQVAAAMDVLRSAAKRGEIAYGYHCQSHSIMTCFVPSTDQNSHRHFLDGMDGGYAKAAAMLRASKTAMTTNGRSHQWRKRSDDRTHRCSTR